MDLCRQFGANVRRLRKDIGLSQEEFAEKAGVARSYMSDVEVGHRNPTLKVVERIAKVLDVQPSTLLE